MKNRFKKPPTFVVELINTETGETKLYPGMLSKYMAKGTAARLQSQYGEKFTTNVKPKSTGN